MALFDPLSGDCIAGYTKAIQDAQEIIKYIQADLGYHHKILSPRLTERLLQVWLDNRRNVREGRGFIRWNRQKNDFEWFGGRSE